MQQEFIGWTGKRQPEESVVARHRIVGQSLRHHFFNRLLNLTDLHGRTQDSIRVEA